MADLGLYRTIHPKKRHTFEIFKILSEARSDNERISIIRQHLTENQPFKQMLMWNFLRRIQSVIPPGVPPYNKNEEDGDHQALWSYLKHFPFFVVSARSQKVKSLKLERMFIDMLESIPNEEAELVLLVKDKKLQHKFNWLKPELVAYADPNTFKDLIADLYPPQEVKAEPKVEKKAEEPKVEAVAPKKKRIRRSKAQIEADKAAKASAEEEKAAIAKANAAPVQTEAAVLSEPLRQPTVSAPSAVSEPLRQPTVSEPQKPSAPKATQPSARPWRSPIG